MQIFDIEEIAMTRDLDLVRDLLIAIDKEPKADGTKWLLFENPAELGITDKSLEEIRYHLLLLLEAKFIWGSPEGKSIKISRLTWEGHEFLDNIRDQRIWAKIKKRIGDLPGVALTIVAQLATAEVKKKLGLS